jgi:hypothetical protein
LNVFRNTFLKVTKRQQSVWPDARDASKKRIGPVSTPTMPMTRRRLSNRDDFRHTGRPNPPGFP